MITGGKMFATGGHAADLIFVLARTASDAAKHAGLSLFLVPRAAAGVTISAIPTFGGERTNAVYLDDVLVGDEAIVGMPGEGWRILNLALDFERQVMAAYSGQADRPPDDPLDTLARQGPPQPAPRHLGPCAPHAPT